MACDHEKIICFFVNVQLLLYARVWCGMAMVPVSSESRDSNIKTQLSIPASHTRKEEKGKRKGYQSHSGKSQILKDSPVADTAIPLRPKVWLSFLCAIEF